LKRCRRRSRRAQRRRSRRPAARTPARRRRRPRRAARGRRRAAAEIRAARGLCTRRGCGASRRSGEPAARRGARPFRRAAGIIMDLNGPQSQARPKPDSTRIRSATIEHLDQRLAAIEAGSAQQAEQVAEATRLTSWPKSPRPRRGSSPARRPTTATPTTISSRRAMPSLPCSAIRPQSAPTYHAGGVADRGAVVPVRPQPGGDALRAGAESRLPAEVGERRGGSR